MTMRLDFNRLQEMLDEANVHAEDCESLIVHGVACTCGVAEARKRLAAKVTKQDVARAITGFLR
jgi:hypothetical protein